MAMYNHGGQNDRTTSVPQAKPQKPPTVKSFNLTLMDSSNKRIDQIMNEMDMIVIDSRNPSFKQTLEKKMINYNKINLLSEEATQLLNKMEMEVGRLDGSHINQSQNMKINDWLDMLNKGHLKTGEIIYIVEQLQAMLQDISSEPDIIDNIEQEIIYEDPEIFDDD